LGKLIKTGKGATREIEEVHLSRYACYLVVQKNTMMTNWLADMQISQMYFPHSQEKIVVENHPSRRSQSFLKGYSTYEKSPFGG
jgi:hypothetical protein